MTYTIELSHTALRKLQSMPRVVQARLKALISSLANNPRPPGASSVKELDKCYRLRRGDYQVIYAVYDDRLIVLVLSVADRKEAYTAKEIAAIRKELRRRLSAS